MSGQVIVVHDDEAVRAAVRYALKPVGHPVEESADAHAIERLVDAYRPEVVLLQWISPRDTHEALLRLREIESARDTRILVLVPRARISAAVAAFDFGADDCVSLPLESSELVARVSAALRRPAAPVHSDQLRAGPLVLDKRAHFLWVRGNVVRLAPTEFRLLAFLLENQCRVFGRQELLRRAWPSNPCAGERTVDVHVRRLRQLLEPYACDGLIQTVRGFGYRLAAEVQSAPSALR
jgi:two-component system phosphate regulon response regulator PhoB